METTFDQDEEKYMFYKNFRRQDFNCFTISYLKVIVHNNNSDIFCFIDDSHDFSERFLFCHNLTGPEIMISGRKNIPTKSQQTQSHICENLILKDRAYILTWSSH